jgi:hypothetical protein
VLRTFAIVVTLEELLELLRGERQPLGAWGYRIALDRPYAFGRINRNELLFGREVEDFL